MSLATDSAFPSDTEKRETETYASYKSQRINSSVVDLDKVDIA
jgi:hypothetical protein